MTVWGASFAPDGHLISVNCDHECLFTKNSKCSFCGMNDAIQRAADDPYSLYRWDVQKRGENQWQPPMSLPRDTSRGFGTRNELRPLWRQGDLLGERLMALLELKADPLGLRTKRNNVDLR